MNTATAKKRARELQAITGMPYQAAHRALVTDTEYQASVRSGYTLSDFVTPREQRIWLQVNTGDLRCAENRHWMPTGDLGQCVGCGITMAVFFNDNGEEYEAPISEEKFLERCALVEMYYNWAPPMAMLDGITQAEYFDRYWSASSDAFTSASWTSSPGTPGSGTSEPEAPDPWSEPTAAAPVGLSWEQLDLLRVVDALEKPDRYPGTKEVGQGLLTLWKERGGPYSWHASAPWHGTSPHAGELRSAGLLDIHVGMANFRRRDEPAATPTQYWLGLTATGRKALGTAASA